LRKIVETSAYPAPARERLRFRAHQQQDPKRSQGEEMKKRFASIFLTLIGILALGMGARANSQNEIVVLPFEFVASGKTLPAGTYTLTPVSDYPKDGLVLSNVETHASVIIHPIETEEATAQKPSASFERVGERRFLNRIQTENTVYNIPVSRAVALQAAMPSHESTPAPVSANSGSN
jgi:hypothetical protein